MNAEQRNEVLEHVTAIETLARSLKQADASADGRIHDLLRQVREVVTGSYGAPDQRVERDRLREERHQRQFREGRGFTDEQYEATKTEAAS